MFQKVQMTRAVVLGVMLCCLASAPPVRGTSIVHTGWDLLVTEPALTTFMGVNWKGVPLDNFNFGGTLGVQPVGLTDTIVQRLSDANGPGVDTIPIELVALHLVSVMPVDLGAGLGSYYLTLQSERGGPASLGSMTIQIGPEGNPHGTFDSFFDVFFDLRFNALDGPIIFSDTLQLTSAGTPWGHEAPAGALTIPGVNSLLDGQTIGQDFWPLQSISETHPGSTTEAKHVVNPTPHVPDAGRTFGLLAAALVCVAKFRKACKP